MHFAMPQVPVQIPKICVEPISGQVELAQQAVEDMEKLAKAICIASASWSMRRVSASSLPPARLLSRGALRDFALH